MRGKGKWLLLFVVLLVGGLNRTVWGYTGNGHSDNPYVVANEGDLRTILTEKGKNSWVYVAVNGNITITKTITPEDGKFRIYSRGTNRTIKRSGNLSNPVNSSGTSNYCFRLNNSTNIQFGYAANSHRMILDGNGSHFAGSNENHGYLTISATSTVTITNQCVVQNVNNDAVSVKGAPITSRGTLYLYGEIKNCQGNNGGALKLIDSGYGVVEIGAKIHHCTSSSEGGAIYVGDDAMLEMNGGEVYECSAKEEGGAFFVTTDAFCGIQKGKIHHNEAGNTGGGIFSGMGGTLELGDLFNEGNGPEITDNTAGDSGGGIRCNGGTGSNAGGTTSIYGTLIARNSSGNYGGGISSANASSGKKSKLLLYNVRIENNECDKNGGGLWIGTGGEGIYGGMIEMTDCVVQKNYAKQKAGGVKLSSAVLADGCNFMENTAAVSGGGFYITEEGTLKMSNGFIKDNHAFQNGAGVYLLGKLQMLGNTMVDRNNVVFLCKGTYIEILGALSKNIVEAANIVSEVNTTGTKIVYVNYGNASASTELYRTGSAEDEYQEKTVQKKFQVSGLQKNQCLRPCENVQGVDKRWIIISEKYEISFSRNTDDSVENMPEPQIKFWNETTNIATNEVKRDGYQIRENAHWNLKANGTGTTYKPGQVIELNQTILLYAQWETPTPKKLLITAPDRYYMVGQDILLNREEVLRKVYVTDDLESGAMYSVQVIEINLKNGSNLVTGKIQKTEQYLNTKEAKEYVLTLRAENETGTLKSEQEMHLFILDSPVMGHQVRFISKDYLNTLSEQSKWSAKLRKTLKNSVERKNCIYRVTLKHEDVEEVRQKVGKKEYRITSAMNRSILKKYGGGV
jgi:hypothetical protein